MPLSILQLPILLFEIIGTTPKIVKDKVTSLSYLDT
jgi:hypothetical protein